MPLTPEEQKAVDHLAQERKREAFHRSLQSSLRALNQSPAEQTRRNWEPLTRLGKIRRKVN